MKVNAESSSAWLAVRAAAGRRKGLVAAEQQVKGDLSGLGACAK
jgi:hypothetical protein